MTQKVLFLLDAGHAPNTAGKRSPLMDDGTRLLEWEVARAIVDRIAAKLEALGIAYHVVTPRTDVDLGPTARANLANEVVKVVNMPALLISVHGNAFTNEWNDANGVTVLYYPSSRLGKELAQELQTKLVAASGLRDRGIKARDDLSILKKTHMPAILSECGFYTNPNEVQILLSEQGRDMFADAHVQFIAQVNAGE